MSTVEQIAEQLDKLTLLEAAQLSKLLQEKWGVSAAAPVAVAAVPGADVVEICVADTGVGIAAEDQKHVFEEFRQVGTDYTRKAEGTGLGLALTKRFVELHGGTIRLASEPGKGSTFTFTVPLGL